MYPKKLQKLVISNPDYPVVATKYGRLRGTLTDDTFIFRGMHLLNRITGIRRVNIAKI